MSQPIIARRYRSYLLKIFPSPSNALLGHYPHSTPMAYEPSKEPTGNLSALGEQSSASGGALGSVLATLSVHQVARARAGTSMRGQMTVEIFRRCQVRLQSVGRMRIRA